MIQLGRLFVALRSAVGKRIPFFAVATEKETGILSAINVQGKKLHTMKTCFNNYRVVSSYIVDWLHELEELVGSFKYCE